MAQYIIAYKGGERPKTPEAGAAHMKEWQAWVMGLGEAAVVPAQPLGMSKIVSTDDVTDYSGDNPWSGYTIVEAADIDAAIAHAKACPFLGTNGTLEVAELMVMPG